MKLSRRQPSETPAMNMTPMIDVVFLLIVFFMTVSQISEIKRARLALPLLNVEQEQSISTLTINVTADDEIVVSGVGATYGQLQAIIQEQVAGDASEMSVVIRADRQANTAVVNEIIRLLGGEGIEAIRFAVQEPAA